jgi:hypothetical protein
MIVTREQKCETREYRMALSHSIAQLNCHGIEICEMHLSLDASTSLEVTSKSWKIQEARFVFASVV